MKEWKVFKVFLLSFFFLVGSQKYRRGMSDLYLFLIVFIYLFSDNMHREKLFRKLALVLLKLRERAKMQ